MSSGQGQVDLARAFAAAYDRSLADEWVKRGPTARDQRLELLGEGSHFRAWLLPLAAGSGPGSELRLVLKVATGDHGRAGTPAGRAWRDALNTLRPLKIDLVPPFAVLDGEDGRPALVMPYGEGAAPRSEDLARREVALAAALSRAGLELAEGATLRTWRGIPFVIDLSDLRRRG
jgi:hypothetical protein